MKKSTTTNKPSTGKAQTRRRAKLVGDQQRQPAKRGTGEQAGTMRKDEDVPTIHNGSAGAFDATEISHDDDDEGPDNDDFAMDR